MQLHGKIARLPLAVREELNRRILEQSHTCEQLADWLNSLPEAKAVCEQVALRRGVASSPILAMEISRWQQTGYLLWLRRRENSAQTQELAQSLQQAQAAGSNLSEQAATVLGEQILELLQSIVHLRNERDSENQEQLADAAKAVNSLARSLASVRLAEHNRSRLAQTEKKLAHAERKLSQADELIALHQKRFQRDTSRMALRILADQRAQEIEASGASYDDKIEIMGQHLFGDLWKPRTEAEKRAEAE